MDGAGSFWLAINGEKVTVPAGTVDGSTSLNEFLRSPQGKCQGVKLGCGQGGCGACTVAVTSWSKGDPTPQTKTVTSCLVPVVSVAGMAVTTVEGLTSEDKAHPIQQRIAHHFGSQCGFCTPGMVMQMYSVLNNTDGGRGLASADMEKALECGNICRCTGYRPILDAGKSFCKDHQATGETVVSELQSEGLSGHYDANKFDPKVPEFIKDGMGGTLALKLGTSGQSYCRAANEADAMQFMQKNAGCVVVAGHTSTGIYGPMWSVGSMEAPPAVLDISCIDTMKQVSIGPDGSLRIGAATTLESLAKFLEGPSLPAAWGKTASTMVRNLRMISSYQVRNRATVGGNLMLTRNAETKDDPHQGKFPSDTAPMMLVLGASLEIISKSGAKSNSTLEAWLSAGPKPLGSELLVAVNVKPPVGKIFESLRVSIRPRNAKATLNAAFLAELEGSTIKSARVVYGALVSCTPQSCPGVEKALVGQDVQKLVGFPLPPFLAEQVEKDMSGWSSAKLDENRAPLVPALLAKFISRLQSEIGEVPANAPAPATIHCGQKIHTSKQQLATAKGIEPFGSAGLPKDRAEFQASGKALYVDDVAMRAKQAPLHAAMVLAQVLPRSVIQEIKPPDASWGVQFFGKEDMKSNDIKNFMSSEKLMIGAGDEVGHWGDPVGIVVSDTWARASWAAREMGQKHIVVSEPAGPCKIYAEEMRALLENGGEIPEDLIHSDDKGSRGNVKKCFEANEGKAGWEKVTGIISKNGQQHWYMEPQCCYVEVDEGRLIVHSSTQFQQMIHSTVASVTGMEMANVETKTRRVGGGFGGKTTPSAKLACMAGLAAKATGRAVRFVLPRSTDSHIVGGRERMSIKYEMMVETKTGTIQALKIDALVASGKNAGMSVMMLGAKFMGVYYVPNVDVRVRGIKTASAGSQTVRGPGHQEASLTAETIIEHAAYACGKSVIEMRQLNFLKASGNPLKRLGFKYGPLPPLPVHDTHQIPLLFQRAQDQGGWNLRQAAINKFNAENAFQKRGLGISMVNYGIFRFGDRAVTVNLYKDGSVLLHIDGIDIGQGIYTKAIQMARRTLATLLPAALQPLPHGFISVADVSTNVIPNIGGVGGSVGSEMVAYAIEDACLQLVKRLSAQKNSKETKDLIKSAQSSPTDEMKETVWRKLVKEATEFSMESPNPYLSAIGRYRPGMDEMAYETYCASVVEVEVDGLTGEYNLRHASVHFEAGPPLHGGVEIGQVEGAYIYGVGAMTTEEVLYDDSVTPSKLLSDNTWTYKVPLARDLPDNFEVDLTNLTETKKPTIPDTWECCFGFLGKLMKGEGSQVPRGHKTSHKRIKSAKATGEPPLVAATAVVSALRSAVMAFGATEFVQLPVPCTVPVVRAACEKAMRAAKASK